MIMITLTVAALCSDICADTLTVGAGKSYKTIAEAYAEANGGDTIFVHPSIGNRPYTGVALQIRKKNLSIIGRGIRDDRIVIDGSGFNYSGARSTSRAAFQFNKGADGGLIEGFEIINCTNSSYNGAGVRISKANDVTVRNCSIHHCDMGMMSGGDADQRTGMNQVIESCVIHHNGNKAHAGYNHNMYMGGDSVYIRGCNIYSSLTGHNIKSRTKRTIVEGSYIHGSANRELDLVDDKNNTKRKNSDALISGCVIIKKPNMKGNKAVIHFGQDGGNKHNGTLYLLNTTVVTPYISPVVDLSEKSAALRVYNCMIIDPTGTQNNQALVAGRDGGSVKKAEGRGLWVSYGVTAPKGSRFSNAVIGMKGYVPSFGDPLKGNLTLATYMQGAVDAGIPLSEIELPKELNGRHVYEFTPPLGMKMRRFRRNPDIGAFEYMK